MSREMNNERTGRKKVGRPPKISPEELRSAAETEGQTVKDIAEEKGVSTVNMAVHQFCRCFQWHAY